MTLYVGLHDRISIHGRERGELVHEGCDEETKRPW